MTVQDYAKKIRRIAQNHGYREAGKAASKEALAKSVVRPYVAYKEQQAKDQLQAQQPLLDDLRARENYTLIVLDAGRYDYLAPILRDCYQGEVQETFSAARDTFEWISQVWQGDYQDVTYLSGMVPVSDEIPDFDLEDFKRLYFGIHPGESIGEIVKLWGTHWDSSVATVLPETITEVARDYVDRDKLVVHYNQPHSPYIGTPKLLGHTNNESATPQNGRPNDEPIWERVRAGQVSDAYLHAAYVSNAVRAIEALEPLVRERETVVITADHGEALGEWGMYTHDRAPHPKRRVVPWMEVTGVGKNTTIDREMDVTDRLKALGYR